MVLKSNVALKKKKKNWFFEKVFWHLQKKKFDVGLMMHEN